MDFYIDTCIWLNLFKKEIRSGKKYYLFAQLFLEKHLEVSRICYSGFVLKELRFVLQNESLYGEKVCFFKKEPNVFFLQASKKDYDFARKLELETNFKLSFFDYLHIALAKNNNLVLITRDKDMMSIAKLYIIVKKPEELI